MLNNYGERWWGEPTARDSALRYSQGDWTNWGDDWRLEGAVANLAAGRASPVNGEAGESIS